MRYKTTRKDCQRLVDEINTTMFNGIDWIFISTNSVEIKDRFGTTLFAEKSYHSLFCDLSAFLLGATYDSVQLLTSATQQER